MISRPGTCVLRLAVVVVLAAGTVVACGSPDAIRAQLGSGTAALSALPYGPDTCRPGYVWREAFDGDTVCVAPTERTLVASENAAAPSLKEPAGGAYGPDTCKPGYVWREASPADHVCVTPARRAQVKVDNAAAADRRATEPSGNGGGSSTGGTSSGAASTGGTAAKDGIAVSGSASGTITDVVVTCRSGGSYLEWNLAGSLNGSKVALAFTTNNYRGAGTYHTTSITDAQGGQLSWYVDAAGKAVSNGNDTGTFVIAADQRSGSVDALIAGDGAYTVHLAGPWTCT